MQKCSASTEDAAKPRGWFRECEQPRNGGLCKTGGLPAPQGPSRALPSLSSSQVSSEAFPPQDASPRGCWMRADGLFLNLVQPDACNCFHLA